MICLSRLNVWNPVDRSMTGHQPRGFPNTHSEPPEISPSRFEEDVAESSDEDQEPISATEPTKARVTSSRLPPRSRTGCWTCRKRKVKCDERHPVCGPCLRLQQNCDYEPRFEFRNDTVKHRSRRRGRGINEVDCPPWDSKARRQYDPRLSQYDDMPPFRALNSEDEWERKASFHRPGTYHVLANQNSFASLPEYSGSGNESSSTALSPTGADITPVSRRGSQGLVNQDPDIVILEQFEGPSEHNHLGFHLQSPTSDFGLSQQTPLVEVPTRPPPNVQPALRVPQTINEFPGLRPVESQRYFFPGFSQATYQNSGPTMPFVPQASPVPHLSTRPNLVNGQNQPAIVSSPLEAPLLTAQQRMTLQPRHQYHHQHQHQQQGSLQQAAATLPSALPPTHSATAQLGDQQSVPGQPTATQAWQQMPLRRTNTQLPEQTGQHFGAPPPMPSRHWSLSLTSGSGSVLEEISGMRNFTYDPTALLPETIEEWEDESYPHQPN